MNDTKAPKSPLAVQLPISPFVPTNCALRAPGDAATPSEIRTIGTDSHQTTVSWPVGFRFSAKSLDW